jgi:lysyl-tRNA synthetase class I
MIDIAVTAGKTEKGEKQQFIVDGLLHYYGKLLRIIFLTNINTFSSETCKAISSVLQELRKFLFELQAHLKCDLKSHIGKALRWVNKFWQVVILAKDVPDLPDLTLDEALVEEAEAFHEHIFHFLIKECGQEVFEQVKKLMPSFITDRFTMVYRLYCEVSPLKDA